MTVVCRGVALAWTVLALAACGGGTRGGDPGGEIPADDLAAKDAVDAGEGAGDPGRRDDGEEEDPGEDGASGDADATGDAAGDAVGDLPPEVPDALDDGTDGDASDPGAPEVPDPGEDTGTTDLIDAGELDDPGGDPGVPDLPDAGDAPDEAPDVPPEDPGPADPGGPDLSATGLCGALALEPWSRKFLHVGGTVTFNEIQYHPANDSRLEWIELFNPMAVDVDLSGWRLDAGIRYAFPEGTFLPARGFLVIAADPPALAAATGYAGAMGPWDGQADNGGELLELRNNAGRLMDAVDYDDREPWPVAPDGSGATLAKRDPEGSSEEAENWTVGNPVGGTPGAPNREDPRAPPALATLVPWDATWAFEAAGADPGDGWQLQGYDDSGWGRGPAPFVVVATQPGAVPVAARLTAQDRFALYVGAPDGTGLRRVGGDPDGAWETVEEVAFEVLPGQHVFVAAWQGAQGDARPQMWIGRFLPQAGDPLNSDAAGFQWIPGPAGVVPEEGAGDFQPDPAMLQALVLEADLAGRWAVPQDQAEAGSDPWGTVLHASFPDGGKYVWGDTLDACSVTDTSRTFALFRSVLPPVPPRPGTLLPGPAATMRFRLHFLLEADPADALPWMDLLLDDGAVAWLNGVEILRRVMPAGEILPDTPASWAVDPAPTWTGNLLPQGALVPGDNVLAVQVHPAAPPDDDLAFAAQVSAWVRPPGTDEEGTGLRFSEVAGGGDPFWVELVNAGTTWSDAGGLAVVASGGGRRVLPAQGLAPGEILLLDPVRLGFTAVPGDRLYLYSADRTRVLDAVEVMDLPRGRPDPAKEAWWWPDTTTPGSPNRFALEDAVVIHEIQYHALPIETPGALPVESGEEWIELHNRGAEPVDLGGWQLVDDIRYTFPVGTVLPGGGHLVVARDAAAMQALHPGAAIVGDFEGRLDNAGATVVLRDACGNPVDQVRWRDGGRWPSAADGGGATLELRDPRADNASPEAWAASRTPPEAEWQEYAYQDVARPSAVGPDGQWQEFVLGLLDEGEILLDDVRVIEDPDGTPVDLLQDGTFENGVATGWRLLGTHRHSQVVADPDDPGNHVLRLVATGPAEHMHNHAETTLKDGRAIADGQTYRVGFRARWVSGSNRLNTRLYFDRVARTTNLLRPVTGGTPGRPNSTLDGNAGPTWNAFAHLPVVPGALQAVRVQVEVSDPDGVAGVTLWYAVDGGPASAVAMEPQGGERWAAIVPGQPAAAIVQFWVEGVDGAGAISSFPADGPASRALWKVDDGNASTTGLHDLRILLTPEDAEWLHDEVNVMSNDLVPATVVYDERQAFYDIGVRLKGSERGRSMPLRTGFSLHFDPDRPFRGVYGSVLVDRSEGVNFGQREMLINQVMCRAGSPSAEYDDLVQVVPPRADHVGPAELQMARFGSGMLDAQFEGGSDGNLYDYELVYYPISTDDGTPEGRKLPQPDRVVGTPIRDLGDDPESYRYDFSLKNNLWRDDFAPLIAFAKAFGLPQEEFEAQVDRVIDVDQWLRAFAFATLSGAVDNYASGAQHNADFYVRPSDGRVLYFPHDLDFYQSPYSVAVVANADLARLLQVPANRRAYYGHLLDIVRTACNGDYLARPARQFGALLPLQDFGSHLQFVVDRAAWVLDGAPDAVNQAIPAVPFEITTNGGADMQVSVGSMVLQGTGWIDVREVYRMGDAQPLPLEWTGLAEWAATVPLECGANLFLLNAVDLHGTTRGSDSITIETTNACP